MYGIYLDKITWSGRNISPVAALGVGPLKYTPAFLAS
jgi:hypothetical protein